MEIGVYSFEGPYNSTDSLKDNSGVYVILGRGTNGRFEVIDIGESATVKTRIGDHDRSDCWEKYAEGSIVVAVHYTQDQQQPGRKDIEQELREQFNPPCGER